MPALTISDYIIGKARLGYRAVGVNTPFTELPTLENTLIRLNAGAELFDPSTEFDLGGPVQGFQYAAAIGGAEVEASISQLDAATLALLVPGSTSVTATTGAVVGSDTTLAAASVVGAQNIKVAAVTGYAVGDYVKIGTGGTIEYRQLTAVGTLGSGGTGLSFWKPLAFAHANAEAVVEVDGDGATTITAPAPARIATTAYKEWSVIWPRPDAAWGELRIFRGLIDLSNPVELETGARTMGRSRITIRAYRNPADTDAAPAALIR